MGRPKGTGGQARELTREEIHRIDRCLSGESHEHRDRALFYLGLGTGMRIGELAGLSIGDLAPHGRVEPQVRLEKHSTKSKRSRLVHLSGQARRQIEAFLRYRFGSLRKVREHLDEPLFPSQVGIGRPLHPRSAIRKLGQMFEVAGVSGASSHSLRRTHANELRRQGVDLKVIQEQLGHSSLATTERYFQVDPLEKAKAIAALEF